MFDATSNWITVEGSGTVEATFSGNRQTCPRCGALADVMDGTYSFAEDAVSVLSAPQLTRDVLQELEAILAAGAAGTVEDDEVLRRLDAIDAKLGDLARQGTWKKQALWVILGAVVSQLLAVVWASATSTPCATEIQNVVRKAVDDAIRQHAPATSAPTPTTSPQNGRVTPPSSVREPRPKTPPAQPGGPNREARRAAMREEKGRG